MLEKISSNEECNEIILEGIFNTRVITLENIHIQLVEEEGKKFVQYYDGNVLENKKRLK